MDGNAKNNLGENRTWTWRDYPEFYENDVIRRIAGNKKWTISDNTKRPIDMHAFIVLHKIWGAAYDRGYNPLTDLKTLIDNVPNCTNNAYQLEADIDKIVVLDIEPKCPDILKKALLELPYLYAETSMSGKGYHLIFDLPQDLWNKYPVIQNKMALKEEHGYYEILLDHMVTFTRNVIEKPEEEKDISEFYNLFEILAAEAKKSKTALTQITVDDIKTDDIPLYDRTMNVLSAQIYGKKPEDFSYDMSKYEFGMAAFYNRALAKLTKNDLYKDINYSDEQKAIIVYSLIAKKLDYREKHDTERNKMPWLLYLATQCIAKSDE